MAEIEVMLDKGAYAPQRAHEADAGYDLRTPIDVILPAHGSIAIDTGVHMAIPKGYVGFIKSKSGLNVKHGIKATGTIDSGYNGSIVVKLDNGSSQDHEFHAGDKITQIVLLPIYTPNVRIVNALEATERGSNGFGSTGV